MAINLKRFIICVVGLQIFLSGSAAQVQKRSICGRVDLDQRKEIARTEVMLDYAGIEVSPGANTGKDGTFCIDNFVGDLSQRRTARLYVMSFCRPTDVMLMIPPFWPALRNERRFAGKNITINEGELTRLGDVNVQLIYGHVRLRILDRHQHPLLTKSTDWAPIWIRVRNQDGVRVYESGLYPAQIEQSVDLQKSCIDLAVPEGTWTLDVALTGVPSNTSTNHRGARWLRVPGKISIESCAKPVDVAVSVL